MTRATPQWSFADLEFRAQNITLDPLLQQISDFIDQHQTLVEQVRRDLQRGLKKPATGRNGLDAPQVLRSLTLMRVKNWDYRELRQRIADGYTLRQFTQFFSALVPKHDAFHCAFVRLTPATLEVINQQVVQAAVALGLEDGKKFRTDTTVVEADIHHPTDQTSIETDLGLIGFYDTLLNQLELFISRQAKDHDSHSFYLCSVPGIGKVLALTILYEIHNVAHFHRVQEFVSYCRLSSAVTSPLEKTVVFPGKKIGTVHLKWAFSAAAVLFLRHNPKGQLLLARLENEPGKEKALTVLAHKLARAVSFMLRREKALEATKFLAA